MTEHIRTKHALKEDINLLIKAMNNNYLSDNEKDLLSFIYIDGHDFNFIADLLSVSEQTVKIRHKKVIQKIAKLMDSNNL